MYTFCIWCLLVGNWCIFLCYLSGFVHCFVGYSTTFLHRSESKLGCFVAGFAIIGGKWGLIGVPPSPLCDMRIKIIDCVGPLVF